MSRRNPTPRRQTASKYLRMAAKNTQNWQISAQMSGKIPTIRANSSSFFRTLQDTPRASVHWPACNPPKSSQMSGKIGATVYVTCIFGKQESRPSECHPLLPAPCSLLPAPCSLLPAPCSLFPAPCSLFPVPCSLFPVPCSLFPVPCSLFPVPCSLFPVPCSCPLLFGLLDFKQGWHLV